MSQLANKSQRGKIECSAKPGYFSWLLQFPENKPQYLVILSHGAGANMEHEAMESYAKLLTELDCAVFRFNFPYLEGKKRGGPNGAKILQDCIRLAGEKAQELAPKLPLIFAGKSMGGRMSSLAQAESTIQAEALIYFGFPLHAPGKNTTERATHLKDIKEPMLFLQGTRDSLAQKDLMEEVFQDCNNPKTQLKFVEGGDHSFKVLKRSGRTDEEVQAELKTALMSFLNSL